MQKQKVLTSDAARFEEGESPCETVAGESASE